ncbi:MAG: M4 family metallopeptidase [Acidobacteriota bacterium]
MRKRTVVCALSLLALAAGARYLMVRADPGRHHPAGHSHGGTGDIAKLEQESRERGYGGMFLCRKTAGGVVQELLGRFTSDARSGFENAVITFVKEQKSLFEIRDMDAEFEKKYVSTDGQGMMHLRMRQMYRGLPVLDRVLIARADRDGCLNWIWTNYRPSIDISTSPVVSPESAVESIRARNEAADSRMAQTDLAIYVNDRQRPTLVHRIWMGIGLGAFEYLVDATNGRILEKTPLFRTAATKGTGRNALGQTITNLNMWQREDFPRDADWDSEMMAARKGAFNLVDLSKPRLGAIYTMTCYRTWYNPWDFVRSANNQFFSATRSDSHPRGVSVHDYFRRTLDYFDHEHLRNGMDDQGQNVIATVDTGDDPRTGGDESANAAWESRFERFFFGVYGGDRPFSAALDVVAHEYTHAVTDHTSNLRYENQSGALNESISDIFGTLVEHDKDPKRSDWLMGEDCYLYGDAVRNMANPKQYAQPDTVGGQYYVPPTPYPSEANDYGGVHTNSGIPNKAFYLMCVGGTHNGIKVAPIYNYPGYEWFSEYMAGYFFYALDLSLAPRDDFMAARSKMLAYLSGGYPGTWEYYSSVQNAWAAVGVGKPWDQWEPNNTRAQATPLRNHAQTEGYIVSDYDYGGTDDEDFFKIGPLVGSVDIKATLTNLPKDYDLELLDYSGNVLIRSDNAGTADEGLAYGYRVYGYLAYYLYLRVYGYDHAGSMEKSYTLTATW